MEIRISDPKSHQAETLVKVKKSVIADFLKQESAGGILLVAAAFLAILMANSPLNTYYTLLIDTPVAVRVSALEIAKPLLLWVNDGLMVIFFLSVGLELKREILGGELSDTKKVVLPCLGAVGGMAVPSAIYFFLNSGDPVAARGWAIPAATDIAFAIGVMSLLGSRVPPNLKIFLISLAIFDDIGAIIIIAFFYTSKISFAALMVAFICAAILYLFNKDGITEKRPYIIVGIVMWVATLKSGVHATLAGVILAMFIPDKSSVNPDEVRECWGSLSSPALSPLRSMENDLHSVVAFVILPIFAFCNSGINLRGTGLEDIFHRVPLGIALGLFIGKQVGVFGFCWLGIKLRLTELPKGVSWTSLYGAAVLCGIGFTMSLFIASLAFEEIGINRVDERLGIILGSLAASISGYCILRLSLPSEP